MSIILNGTTLSDIVFNGVSLDKVIYNGITVFEKAPAIIREPASGEYYITTAPTYDWVVSNGTNNNIYWNSPAFTPPVGFFSGTSQTFISNGYTYYRGSYKSTIRTQFGQFDYYGIYRIKN